MSGENTRSRVWFYYASEVQVGPMGFESLREAIECGAIGIEDYVFREGFHDWRRLGEIDELSEIARASVRAPESNSGDRTVRSRDRRIQPRAPLSDLVVAHNDNHLTSGLVADISASGIYLETSDNCFRLNDEVKITLKHGTGLGKPILLRGTVVRQTSAGRSRFGYGVELMNLDERTRTTISAYVKGNQAS